MHETITLQLGQCGNQVGQAFWERIAAEHGIALDGSAPETTPRGQSSRYFYTTDSGRSIPRAVLIDSEPRVVSRAAPLFGPDAVVVTSDGGGAGNNWAQGFQGARQAAAAIADAIQREAEGCDTLEGFNVLHSVAGGTGSGVGSHVLASLRDAFPKTAITGFALLPSSEEGADVVVQPYNAVLALSYVRQHCDCVVMLDNHALSRVVGDSVRERNISYGTLNALVAAAAATCSATIRFPSYTYADTRALLASAVPVPDFKFVIPSYAPFSCNSAPQLVRRTTAADVMRRLVAPKARLCTYEPSRTHADLARLHILAGGAEPQEIVRELALLQSRRAVNPVAWMPPFFHTALASRDLPEDRVRGLALANTTGVAALLRTIGGQFDALRRRSAFMEIYKKHDVGLEVFDGAREALQQMVESYEMCELQSPLAG